MKSPRPLRAWLVRWRWRRSREALPRAPSARTSERVEPARSERIAGRPERQERRSGRGLRSSHHLGLAGRRSRRRSCPVADAPVTGVPEPADDVPAAGLAPGAEARRASDAGSRCPTDDAPSESRAARARGRGGRGRHRFASRCDMWFAMSMPSALILVTRSLLDTPRSFASSYTRMRTPPVPPPSEAGSRRVVAASYHACLPFGWG